MGLHGTKSREPRKKERNPKSPSDCNISELDQ